MSLHSVQVQHGQKVLKTKVLVIGRFIIRPDEEFNALVARQLIEKAKRRNAKVSTELRVFDNGIQLGDHGVFASMPIEFIRYHRLSDMVVLTNEPSTLVICVKDYEQRCVTVVRLKDSISLKVVTDVINRHKLAFMEEYSEIGSTRQRNDQPATNANAQNASIDVTDRGGGRAAESGEPDYAIIRRRELGTRKPPTPPPPPPPQMTKSQASSSNGSFFTRITVPAGPTYLEARDRENQDSQRHSLHEQYQARRSQLLQSSRIGREESTDELEMAAVFETRDGPPTLLNEPSRYVAKVTDGGRMYEIEASERHRAPASTSNWRLAQRGDFYKGSGTAFRIEQQ